MAATHRNDPAIYERIAAELRAAIDSGELGPGARVPGEDELMAKYNVARETARKALAVLKAEGLVFAKQGARGGTFVREFRPLLRDGIKRLSARQWGSGRSIWEIDLDGRPKTEDVTVTVEDAPTWVARILELDPPARVCVRSRRYVVEDKPVMLATSYLPADLVAGSRIMEVDTGEGGIYARLKDLGHEPKHFREDIRARMPRPEEAERLRLHPGTPVVVIVRTAYTEDGRAVEVNEMTLDAWAYVLRYEFDS
ncbi:GntR family transcriptional regulator [Carbonactinospora thermoautotrophica]|uniref:GntR family transcriptional regulator n=1 Tax=Carbonactinospora thermoautotrophica TaxID=1469144 RepID=A0A132MQK3_9ACTN|nr:GntR family transcriptional regulator [Carbonactinospora thermoautotrophica]KWX00074.1 GntR family transcriptional regulator [Carbonactinospora thermoautotrophica]KWX10330.1 GntR family transcriptional regulator [Carbonactinospora thermoautotrophica]